MYQNIEMNKKIISQENGDLAFLMATKCLYPMATFFISDPIRDDSEWFWTILNDSMDMWATANLNLAQTDLANRHT